MHRLITIYHSHYCEKARWALERARVPFEEECHAPVMQVLPAWRAGGRRTVPVLVLENGSVYNDSSDIVRFADSQVAAQDRLVPEEQSEQDEALEATFNEVLGPHARRLIYSYVLEQTDLFLPLMRPTLPRFERWMARPAMPFIKFAITRLLRITPDGVERSRKKTRKAFDQVAERLAGGADHLSGERFGVLDLTFAALGSLVVMPPQYTAPWPKMEALAPQWRQMVEEFRDHPAGRYIMTLYEEERAQTVSGTVTAS